MITSSSQDINTQQSQGLSPDQVVAEALLRYRATQVPEAKRREILANVDYETTTIEPNDPDYERKLGHLIDYVVNSDKKHERKQKEKESVKRNKIKIDSNEISEQRSDSSDDQIKIKVRERNDQLKDNTSDDSTAEKSNGKGKTREHTKNKSKNNKKQKRRRTRSPSDEGKSETTDEFQDAPILNEQSQKDVRECLQQSLHISYSEFKPLRYNGHLGWQIEVGKQIWTNNKVWKSKMPSIRSHLEPGDQYANAATAIAEVQSSLLNAAMNQARGENSFEEILHSYKMACIAQGAISEIREIVNSFGPMREVAAGLAQPDLISKETYDRTKQLMDMRLLEQRTDWRQEYDSQENDQFGQQQTQFGISNFYRGRGRGNKAQRRGQQASNILSTNPNLVVGGGRGRGNKRGGGYQNQSF
ncbi:MAG: hypothetical protein EZS28_009324 [Streblomastix strix]|uniref:Uncharacterized protein n=1 Tax=Streblomastix strix TaxID=222440 RepID=A0A5J4WJY3_9EUKA|nr:MAG: hypothetical protein EZS28_009324 [Streblomastix strix]